MFWGLIMEPKRRYTQDVTKAFHVSMAALDISSSDSEPTQVMCGVDGRNYLLCTLQKGKTLQCPLDLSFEVGTKISFATNGNSHVHLTGYLTDDFANLEEEEVLEEEEAETEASGKAKKRKLRSENGIGGKKMKTLELLEAINSQESDDDSDANFSDLLGAEEDDDDEDGEEEAEDEEGEEEEDEDEDDDEDEVEDEEEDEDEESSLSEEEEVEQKPKINGTPLPKKNKQKENQTPAKQKVETPKNEKQKTPKSEKKNQQQQKEKTPNQQKQKDTPAKSPDAQQQKKRTVEGGVIIEEIRVGNGQVAKPGKVCQVYYEGKLKNNNKVFDATTKGAGFKFRLGKQEVIKGWDIGLNGMKVGGKRRITCPPNMGYGLKGSPPAIPPNSTLVFEVELKNVH